MDDRLNGMSHHPDGKKRISYSDAVIMAKAQIYGEAHERGEYVSESMIEETVKKLAAELMRELAS